MFIREYTRLNKRGEDKVKIRTFLLLMICSLALVACNDQKGASKVIEIQELINFDEVRTRYFTTNLRCERY